MTSVLLINPPITNRNGSIWRGVASVMPPLGLAAIAAFLEREGIAVTICDAAAEGLNVAKIMARYQDKEYDFVGISASTRQFYGLARIAQALRQHNMQVKIVAGGVHPSALPHEVLMEAEVDYVIRGEGEQAMLDLVRGKDIDAIGSLSWKAGDGIVDNPAYPLIADIDTLPMPSWHLLPMDAYYPAVGAAKRSPAVSFMCNRGCPGRCTFCYRIFGNRLRLRSINHTIDEIRHLIDNYGICEIAFYDDTFTSVRKQTAEFCATLIREKIDLTWSCFSRVDRVDEDLLHQMKAAGCHQILYGVETASPEVLAAINKQTDLTAARKAVWLTRKAGITNRVAFMLGNPGDTPETMEASLALALEMDPDIAIFNVATPYPGTEMFRWAKEHGYLKHQDWDQYDLAQAVMELPGLPAAVVDHFYHEAYHRFYLRASYMWKRARRLSSLHDIKNAIAGLRGVINV